MTLLEELVQVAVPVVDVEVHILLVLIDDENFLDRFIRRNPQRTLSNGGAAPVLLGVDTTLVVSTKELVLEPGSVHENGLHFEFFKVSEKHFNL